MGGDAGDIYADSHTSMTLAKMLKRRKTRFIDYSHLLSVTWHGLRATQLIRFGVYVDYEEGIYSTAVVFFGCVHARQDLVP